MKEKLFNLNFVLCRHFSVHSNFFLSIIIWSAWRIASFSERHKLQRLPPHLCDGASLRISHFRNGSSLAFIAGHTVVDSDVAFFSFFKRLIMIVISSFELSIAACDG